MYRQAAYIDHTTSSTTDQSYEKTYTQASKIITNISGYTSELSA